VTEQDVNVCWREYTNSLPQAQSALAGRMKAMQIKSLDDNNEELEVVVNNTIAEKDLRTAMPSILLFLRRKLANSKLNITIRVRENTDQPQAFTRPEKFASMVKKNPALGQLKDFFDLEFC
jgi:hypothetical protein